MNRARGPDVSFSTMKNNFNITGLVSAGPSGIKMMNTAAGRLHGIGIR